MSSTCNAAQTVAAFADEVAAEGQHFRAAAVVARKDALEAAVASLQPLLQGREVNLVDALTLHTFTRDMRLEMASIGARARLPARLCNACTRKEG